MKDIVKLYLLGPAKLMLKPEFLFQRACVHVCLCLGVCDQLFP